MPNPNPADIAEAKKYIKLFSTSTFCNQNLYARIQTILAALEAEQKERKEIEAARSNEWGLAINCAKDRDNWKSRAERAEAEVVKLQSLLTSTGWN